MNPNHGNLKATNQGIPHTKQNKTKKRKKKLKSQNLCVDDACLWAVGVNKSKKRSSIHGKMSKSLAKIMFYLRNEGFYEKYKIFYITKNKKQ